MPSNGHLHARAHTLDHSMAAGYHADPETGPFQRSWLDENKGDNDDDDHMLRRLRTQLFEMDIDELETTLDYLIQLLQVRARLRDAVNDSD